MSMIEKINFIKFKRNDITKISYMFCGCSSLNELNIPNINTNNVTDMSYMFSNCYRYHLYLIYQNGILIMLLI